MGLIQKTSVADIPKSSREQEYDDVWAFSLDYDEADVPVIILNNDDDIPIVDAVELYDGKRIKRAAVLANQGKDCPFTNLYEETGNKKMLPKKHFVFTVLDLRGYTNKAGEKKFEYVKRACIVKGHMMDKMFKKKLVKTISKHGSLRGAKFEVSRGPNMNPSPPSCGDQWEFVEMVDLDQYPDNEILTEKEVLSLFVTDLEELKSLAEIWREVPEAAKPKY